jgi:RNA polymerase sigma-70 factor (ECF subfamily)
MHEGADFDEVARAHGPMIRRVAAIHEADPSKADELAQEILTAVWRALPAWRGEASLKSFVGRIAHNRALSHVARERTRPRTAALDATVGSDAPSPFDLADRAQREAALLRAVRELPVGMREAVALTLEGLTPQEIADVLGTNANIVSIRLTRAKAQLRRFFEADQRVMR